MDFVHWCSFKMKKKKNEASNYLEPAGRVASRITLESSETVQLPFVWDVWRWAAVPQFWDLCSKEKGLKWKKKKTDLQCIYTQFLL